MTEYPEARSRIRAGKRGVLRGGMLALVLLTGISGCGYYSFSGATIQEHISTVAVPLVDDNSLSTITGLDEELTLLLIDRFVRQTRLSLAPEEDAADALLTASISRYVNASTSVSGNERATRNRVTITVSVTYMDQVKKSQLLERSFSNFEEYDPLDPSREEEAAKAALVKIADDIFTAATSNW
jgi:Lipopolysaccharide-assembly